ncbi:tetratricopeptide repeat protein [Lutibacter citreus]|uniref:tetratricopeptide repeat protein n=1 Tax=Lutibacter citreus TaxID=2138210 RepID=UPI000DBE1A56|nr:tetratricopeptide repeat protein [Lutibacter citreus]
MPYCKHLKQSLFSIFIILIVVGNIFGQIKNKNLQSLLKEVKQDTIQVQLLIDKGDYLYYTFPDSSYIYYNEGLKISQKIKNKKFEALSLLNIGYYLDDKSRHKESLEYYLKAIELYKSINDQDGLAHCYNYIGYSFAYLNSIDNSIKYYLKSLNLYSKLKDSSGMANVYDGFGNLYYDQDHYAKAHEYYLKSLNIYKKTNDKEGLVSGYINLGNAISELGKLDEGIDLYNSSIKISKELNDTQAIAINYSNIAECYIVKEDYKIAQKFLKESLKITKEINYKALLPMIYSNMARINLETNNFNFAIKYAKKSIESVKDVSFADMDLDAHLYLSTAYEKTGAYKKAYEAHKKFKKFTDSIYNEKRTEQLAKLDVLYKLESQETKIAQLTKNKEINLIKNKNHINLIYILSLFSVFFLILIYVLNKQRKENKKSLDLVFIEKEKAEESDRLKSAFLANMSHEIRTPMNAILGFSSFLKNPQLKEEKRNHFVDIISISGKRLLTIINDIIDISKIESNQLKIDNNKFNIEDSLKEIIEIQKKTNIQLVNKEINLHLITPKLSKTYFINTDQNRFTQILNNLINNAIKFTDNGKIEVGFSLKKYRSIEYFEFYVKDSGCGIPKDKFNLIFDRFSQAGENDFKEGNGLGLSICKGLITLLKGEIWLESEEKKGTTFYFTLPH